MEVQHDPLTALDGGSDGLSLIRRLIDLAPERLEAEGFLALEIGHDQSPEVVAQFAVKNVPQDPCAQGLSGIRAFRFGSLAT